MSAEPALIPPHASVVLLSGVAGDLESDTLYAANLQNWLDLARRAGAARVLVLCENPEALKSAAENATNIFRADRENFLALERQLAGTTNPLVIIAWGHGGKQGRVPVLHVRGPRLTPDDFKKLAAAHDQAPSTWVLMFRGSGTFARELAGGGRMILASEHATEFASDPGGLQLLATLARERPQTSLPQLAEAFGLEVQRWYRERNLARTEEPTLWLNGEAPRLLAKVPDKTGEREGTAIAQNKTPEPAPLTNKPVLPLTETGSALPWSRIHRVRPADYPDADAVLLRKRVNYTIGSNPAILAEHEQFIQILTPEGKFLADFDISYAPPFEEVNFLDCEILQPGGRLVRVNPEAVREFGSDEPEEYQAGVRRVFSLPGAMPGAILHVRYQNIWKKYPLPHVSLRIPMESRLPARETTLEVTVPAKSAFHFAAESLSAADPQVRQGAYGTTYTWQLGPSSPATRETLSPPDRRPRMLLSTFPDWRTFAEWYERMVRMADQTTPELEAKALELTGGLGSEREKLIALYNYVTALRYVAVPLGVNSLRPHAADSVLRNQYGDCKDKANLLNTLLRSIKIPADLVLVPRFEHAYESLPGASFNHAISRVRLGTETLWLDTTEDICRFGLLPPGDPRRKVLVIDGQTAALQQLPECAPQAHTLGLQGTIDSTSQIPLLPVSLTAKARGYADYDLRHSAREARESANGQPLIGAMLRPVSGAFALEKQSSTAVSALNEDFSWKAEGTWSGLVRANGFEMVLSAPFWVPHEWELALHARKTPLYLNDGYPATFEQEFHFALPEGARIVTLPGNAGDQAQPLTWSISWRQAGQNRISAAFRAQVCRGELTMNETTRIQEQLRNLFVAMASMAVVSTAAQKN